MDALVFGSIMSDITVFGRNIKKMKIGWKNYFSLDYGSKTEVDRIEVNNGGSGHNIAYGLAKMGRKTGIIGCVGNDIFGEKILIELNEVGVDATCLKKINKPTGASVVVIGKDSERSILISRGANDYVQPSQVNKDYVNNFKVFVFTTIVGKKSLAALDKTVKLAKRLGLRIIANPSATMIKYEKKHLKKLIRVSDIAIMNEEEAILLTEKNLANAMMSIKNMGPSIVVITRSDKGVIAMHNNNQYTQRAYDVKRVDTTGAGDAFTVGFLHSLMRKDSFEYTLKFGCACSAFNVQSYGAVKDFPIEDDIIKMISEENV